MQASHSVVQASKASCQSHPALNPVSATHHSVSTLKTAHRLTSQIFSRLTVHKYIKSLWLYFSTVYFDTHPASCNWRERKQKKKLKVYKFCFILPGIQHSCMHSSEDLMTAQPLPIIGHLDCTHFRHLSYWMYGTLS